MHDVVVDLLSRLQMSEVVAAGSEGNYDTQDVGCWSMIMVEVSVD